jgi:hypothetical protein
MMIARVQQIRVHETRVSGTRIRTTLIIVEFWTVTLAVTLTVCAATCLALCRLMLARVHQIWVNKTGVGESGLWKALINKLGEGLGSFTLGKTFHIIPR